MRNITTYLLILIVFTSFSCQKKEGNKNDIKILSISILLNQEKLKTKSLDSTIYDILKYFNNKNEEELNKLIHPEVGMFFLYRRGTVDEYKNLKELALKKESLINIEIPWWYRESLMTKKIFYNHKVELSNDAIMIECDSILKKGLFIVDNDSSKTILIETMKRYKSFMEVEDILRKEDLDSIEKQISKEKERLGDNRRIVLAENNNNSFIFHVIFIKGKWYLYVLDYVTNDCSV